MVSENFPTDEPAVVTAALPAAAGKLNIGGLRGYVAGDVLNRALQRIGQRSIYVSGSDPHGTPVAVKAWKNGRDPEPFTREWHQRFHGLFADYNIDFDHYGYSHDESNRELVQDLISKLDAADLVYDQEQTVAWINARNRTLPDQHIEGTCPHCGKRARGDECVDGCGRELEPGEVEDPTSSISGEPAEYCDRPHKFFTVSDLEDALCEYLDDIEGTDISCHHAPQWIEDGLEDWWITRDIGWGIEYPSRGGDEQSGTDPVLSLWVTAPIQYITSTKLYSRDGGSGAFNWEDVWKAKSRSVSNPRLERSNVVHVLGRDILKPHAILWPAMLYSAGYSVPRAICATGFITINGKDILPGQNRVIWAQGFLDEGFDPDLLRFHLMTVSKLQKDTNFTWPKFADSVNGELVGIVGNFVHRAMVFAHDNYGGTPDAHLSETVEEAIGDRIDDFQAAVNEYDVRAIGREPVELAQFGNEYIQRHEPWSLIDEDPSAAWQVIRDCIQLVKAIAVLAEPIMPGKAEEIWTQLDESGSVHDADIDDALAVPPNSFGDPAPLFAKIDDDRVEELDAELQDRIESASGEGMAETTVDDKGSVGSDRTVHNGDLEAID